MRAISYDIALRLSNFMKFVAIVKRTLKAGKTYDDYRKAWFHTNGFGIPTTMYTVVTAFNPREIILIGILDGDEQQLFNALSIDVKDLPGAAIPEIYSHGGQKITSKICGNKNMTFLGFGSRPSLAGTTMIQKIFGIPQGKHQWTNHL